MAKKYVGKITLEINGTEITEFKDISIGAVKKREQVELAGHTGVANVTPRRTLKVSYVIPADKAEFDFEGVEDGTLTVDYENGTRRQWKGVTHLETGEEKFSGKDASKEITFHADDEIKG